MKNIVKTTFIAICLIISGFSSFAQGYQIFGNVSNNQDFGLQGQIITVTNENTAASVVTDIYGNYDLVIGYFYPNSFIEVSYVDSCGNAFAEIVQYNQAGSSEVNFVSCSSTNPGGDCYADFYYMQPTNDYTTISFFDNSFSINGEIDSWLWSFGDGSASTEQNPVHTYNYAGEYIVDLTISSGDCTANTSYYIWLGNDTIVYPEDCYANFYYGFQGTTVSFYDASYSFTPNYECVWDFGDGITELGQNPTHTYNELGTYFVTLTIFGDSCQSTYSDYIYLKDTIYNGCYAYFGYYQDWYYENTIYFENYSSVGINANGTINSFVEWNFGDGQFSNEFSPIHIYQEEGVYAVTLTVSDSICGLMTYTQEVWVENYPYPSFCQADFWFYTDEDGYVFNFFNNSFTATNYYEVEWNFGDGVTSTEFNPVHTYFEDGQYIVSLTIYSDSCSSTVEQYVWVGDNNWYPEECQAFFFTEYNPENIFDINFYDFSYGNGEYLTYAWDFGDGYGSSLQNPHHIYDATGEYLVNLTITSNFCSSTFSQYIYIEDWTWFGGCQALFFPEFTGTLDVQFFDLSFPTAQTWLWSFGDGTTSNEQNPLHTFSEPGFYTITLEISTDSSCFSAFQMEIELFENENKSTTYGGRIITSYAIHSEGATAIENVNLNTTSIAMYPNPVTNELNLNISENFENAQVQIISITGQIIYNNYFTNDNILINTSSLNNGIYVARIIVDGKIYNQKFVK